MVRVAMMSGTTITGIIVGAAIARFWSDASNAFSQCPERLTRHQNSAIAE